MSFETLIWNQHHDDVDYQVNSEAVITRHAFSHLLAKKKKKKFIFKTFWNSSRNCSTVNGCLRVTEQSPGMNMFILKGLEAGSNEHIQLSVSRLAEMIHWTEFKSATYKQTHWYFGHTEVFKLPHSKWSNQRTKANGNYLVLAFILFKRVKVIYEIRVCYLLYHETYMCMCMRKIRVRYL